MSLKFILLEQYKHAFTANMFISKYKYLTLTTWVYAFFHFAYTAKTMKYPKTPNILQLKQFLITINSTLLHFWFNWILDGLEGGLAYLKWG